MATAVDTPVAGVPAAGPDAAGRRRRLGSGVLWAAAGIVLAQLVVRAWVAARGGFYWDDLILAGRAGSLPLFSSEFLLYDHDGHFMPAAFLLAGALTRLAPLQWWAPVVSLVALQTLASLAVLRLLRLLLGNRPALLLPLTVYLFTPLTLPSFAWWAAALNALPLQAGLAWVAADAVLLVRTGRRRYALSGTAAYALALAFFEKSLLVPFFALAVVLVLGWVTGRTRVIRTALLRGRGLWIGILAVTAVWGVLYTSVVTDPAGPIEVSASRAAWMVGRSAGEAVLPTLLGGPWSWDRLLPSTPWAAPPPGLVAVGLVGTAVALMVVSLRRRRALLPWAMVGGYVAVNGLAMTLGRGGDNDLLPLTLRYVADSAVVVAAAMALVLCAPLRPAAAGLRLPPRGRAVLGVLTTAAFVASSLWSTVTFSRLWSDYPTRAYLANARADLAAGAAVPLLDQQVAEEVLGRLTFPHDLASQVFSPLTDRPRFATSTPELRMLDDSGHLVPARVAAARSVLPGPVRDCGHFVSPTAPAALPLDGPLLVWEWTIQVNYLASRDGVLEVSLLDGKPVEVDVRAGLHSVFLRIRGGGQAIGLLSRTAGLTLCVDSGAVGHVERSPGA